jgi:polyhydroxybutyrate depolymerase
MRPSIALAPRLARSRGASVAVLALAAAMLASCGGDANDLGAPACVGKAGVAGEFVRDLSSDGRVRRFRLTVPTSYDAARPAPLVFDFHGFDSDSAEQQQRSEMRASGAVNGYVVVTPDGWEKGWNAEVCCGSTVGLGVDDVQFVRDMVASVEADYCIDPDRVYAAGYSNGGLFSILLACRANDVIAAAASVAASSLEAPRCQPSRPVAVMFLNGTADPVVPYALAAEPSAELWRSLDGCEGAPVPTYAQGDSSCVSSKDCDGGTEVALCTIEGGGHTWPGGGEFPSFLGPKTEDLSATDAIWEFFRSHPRPSLSD